MQSCLLLCSAAAANALQAEEVTLTESPLSNMQANKSKSSSASAGRTLASGNHPQVMQQKMRLTKAGSILRMHFMMARGQSKVCMFFTASRHEMPVALLQGLQLAASAIPLMAAAAKQDSAIHERAAASQAPQARSNTQQHLTAICTSSVSRPLPLIASGKPIVSFRQPPNRGLHDVCAGGKLHACRCGAGAAAG